MRKPDSLHLSVLTVLFGLALFSGGCFSPTPSRGDKSIPDADPTDTLSFPGDSRKAFDTTDANSTSGSTGGSTTGNGGGSQKPSSSGGTTAVSSNSASGGSGGSWGSGATETDTGRVVGSGAMAGATNTGSMVGGSIVPPILDAGAGAVGTTPDAATPDRPASGGVMVGGASSGGAGGARTGGTTTGGAVADAAIPSDAPMPQPDAGAPLGTFCTTSSTCASGVCADGVCCDSTCTGCKACTLALTGKTTGQCNFVQAGKVAHSACTASGTTCGTDGYCDGNGACRVTAGGAPCGSTCSGSTYTPNTCNGAGACTPGTSSACAPYACNGDVCATSCEAGTELCGSACVDKLTNPSHCGTCNHSCLGGTCAEGMCQPYLLADEAVTWAGAPTFMLTGDDVFIEFGTQGGTPPTNWAVDRNGGGTVKLRDVPAVTGDRTPAVALDGRLYWFTTSGATGQLLSCPQNSCTPGNTTTVLPISCQDGWTLSVANIIADPANHEIVWHEAARNSAPVYYSHTAKRSGPNGPARTVASYVTDYQDIWVVPNNSPNRVFSLLNDDSSYSTYKLYSLLTTSTSASPLAITGSMSNVYTYGVVPVLANSTAAFVSTSSSYSILRIPLPNGLTGVPPAYYTGDAKWSLVEDTYVYGTTVGSTNDGIWRCSLSNCSPSYIARGFLTYGTQIISDSTSLYILDRTSSGARFKLWRMAK